MQEDRLGTQKISSLFCVLTLPAIIAQLVNMLYNIVDRIYIGHIPITGMLALTGVGLSFPIIILISAFTMLITTGSAARASIYLGEKKSKKADEIMGNSLMLLVFLSIILTLIFFFLHRPLIMLFGGSASTIDYASNYIKIYVLGTLFMQVSIGMNTFITAQGFAKISMLTILIGAFLNIILDPILIFTFDLGVQGAALATIFSQAVSMLFVLHFLTHSNSILQLKLRYFKLNLPLIMPCILLGLSPFVMQFTESLLNICFNYSLAKYGGDLAIGAMTILMSIMQLLMLPIIGLTQGAQPLIGFNFGAGHKARVQKSFKYLIITSLGYAIILWGLLHLFPDTFIHLFTTDTELSAFTIWALRFYFLGAFTMGAQIACQQTFVAMGNAKTSLFLALLRKGVFLIPLMFILPLLLPDPVMAVYLSEGIADILAALVTCFCFYRFFTQYLKNPS